MTITRFIAVTVLVSIYSIILFVLPGVVSTIHKSGRIRLDFQRVMRHAIIGWTVIWLVSFTFIMSTLN